MNAAAALAAVDVDTLHQPRDGKGRLVAGDSPAVQADRASAYALRLAAVAEAMQRELDDVYARHAQVLAAVTDGAGGLHVELDDLAARIEQERQP